MAPLEAHWEEIAAEVDALRADRIALPEVADVAGFDQGNEGSWTTYTLFTYGTWLETHCARCPVTTELVRDIPQAALLHIDETGHLEDGKLLWLGVFICTNTCLYPIGHRSAEFLDTLLMGVFHGCLMSDGYAAYRRFLNRLRC